MPTAFAPRNKTPPPSTAERRATAAIVGIRCTPRTVATALRGGRRPAELSILTTLLELERGGARCGRERQRENCATRHPAERDLALHRLGELAGDREAQPAPRRPAGAVASVEALEHTNGLPGGDPRTVVLDGQDRSSVLAGGPYADARPAGRVTKRILDQRAADLEDPLLVAEAGRTAVDLGLEPVLAALGEGFELVDEKLGDPRQIHGLVVDAETTRVEAGEVEQLAGELRQALDLLAHAGEELAAGLLVQVLVEEQLEVPAQREEGRPQLVRRVGDELAPGVLEPCEALAHALERPGELSELVRARVLDRLVELPARDPLYCLL